MGAVMVSPKVLRACRARKGVITGFAGGRYLGLWGLSRHIIWSRGYVGPCWGLPNLLCIFGEIAMPI